eukprot:SAG11_NODE_33039_length_279_cov_0.977778_2_plen_31_part_01
MVAITHPTRRVTEARHATARGAIVSVACENT